MNLFNFKEEYVLENARVRLQPLQRSDSDALITFALNEPTLWKYSMLQANSPDRMEAYIDRALSDRGNETSYPFLVFDKHTNKVAGSTRFYDYQKMHNTVQLGYTWYGNEFWGTGLNKNCKWLMLSFAFDTLGLHRVEFRADNNNKRSIAAMKSIGCTVEGVLRSNCASDTGRRDSIVLSILHSEWKDNLKTQLEQKLTLINK